MTDIKNRIATVVEGLQSLDVRALKALRQVHVIRADSVLAKNPTVGIAYEVHKAHTLLASLLDIVIDDNDDEVTQVLQRPANTNG